MLQTFKYYLISAGLILVAACSAPTNMDDIIQEDTYIDLLTELHLLSAIEETYPDSTLRDEGLQAILNKRNISIEAFEESHNYYLQDVDGQRKRLEEADRRLKEEYERLNQVSNELREEQRQARLREQE